MFMQCLCMQTYLPHVASLSECNYGVLPVNYRKGSIQLSSVTFNGLVQLVGNNGMVQ